MSMMNVKEATRPRSAGKFQQAGISVLAGLVIGASAMLASAPAEADGWHHRHHDGAAVAAGVLGGLALGAAVGSVYAAPPTVVYEDDYPPVYEDRYVERRLPSCSDFRRVDWRHRVWFDDYGRAHPCY